MKTNKSNSDWVLGLGFREDETIEALRDILVGASIVYLHKQFPELCYSDIHCLAEDLAQDATMQILDSLSSFRGESRFTTWACSVVIHLATDEFRHKRYTRNVRIDDKKDPMRYLTSLLHSRDKQVTAENMAERRNILEIISGIIESLPERQRKAVIGICLKQLPAQAVAESVGMNTNALYKCIHDARVKILAGLRAKYLTLGDIFSIFED